MKWSARSGHHGPERAHPGVARFSGCPERRRLPGRLGAAQHATQHGRSDLNTHYSGCRPELIPDLAERRLHPGQRASMLDQPPPGGEVDREFVWNLEQGARLCDILLRDYPIGFFPFGKVDGSYPPALAGNSRCPSPTVPLRRAFLTASAVEPVWSPPGSGGCVGRHGPRRQPAGGRLG
jgi:hypothetical protein